MEWVNDNSAAKKKIVAENANLREEIKALITENDSLKAKIGIRSEVW